MTLYKTILRLRPVVSSLIMMAALAWLTVSLPYVYAHQQAGVQKECSACAEDDGNPLTNSTEEKTESGAATPSEYLHDTHQHEHPAGLVVTSYKWHPADLYVAFHPEFICPPPDGCA